MHRETPEGREPPELHAQCVDVCSLAPQARHATRCSKSVLAAIEMTYRCARAAITR
jgi:hypothetical protein